jgi:putative SOS response-associated peptidase YedK
MCGRFTFQPTEEFYQCVQVINRLDSLMARYNIAPGHMAPVSISQSRYQIMLMRWGLIPHWAKAIMNHGDTATDAISASSG